MASAPSSGAGTCRCCGKSLLTAPRQYLNLKPLCLHELPPHTDTTQYKDIQEPTLAAFLNAVLTEAYQVDFDDLTWSDHGKYPSSSKPINVRMPAYLQSTELAGDVNVPVEVDKRVKGRNSSAFLARRSHHSVRDVDYKELDTVLAQNHCQKEAAYDPSIFDGNELLQWSAEDLQGAVAQLNPEWRVKGVQMSMFEMFHEMPKIMTKPLLQDRVFHVLCISAHSVYRLPGAGDDNANMHPQSHTVQLPINIESFQSVHSLVSQSRFRPELKTYNITEQSRTTERQMRHNGKKVTEGMYCSLERLRHAPGGSSPLDLHRWDMMTRSDAKGSTRWAPWSTKRKETLQAIAKDVHYVLEHIRKLRLATRGAGDSTL